MVVSYEAPRLQVVYHAVLLFQFPVEGYGVAVVVPPSVEPYGADFSVAGEQFGNLPVHEVVVCRPVGFCGVTSGSVAGPSLGIFVARPVEVRVVQMKLYALPAALFRQFFQDVFLVGGGIHDVVWRLCGVPHGEAVVVARCEAYVSCSRLFYRRYPFGGIEVGRIKTCGSFCIFVAVEICVVQIPFALCEHAVYSPVDEYAEPCIGKFLLGLDYFLRGCVGCVTVVGMRWCVCGNQGNCRKHECSLKLVHRRA